MTLLAPRPHRNGARRRAVLVALLLLPACARPLPRPPALPGKPAREEARRPPPTPGVRARPRLSEEAIELEPAPTPPAGGEAESRNGARPAPPEIASAPSPLSAIDSAAPPRTVAATRLTEEARVRLNTGDHDGALEQLERAIAVDPQNGYAYYFLATAHFRRRAYDQAILFADRAAALLEGRDSAWASRACALEGRVYETVARFADARAAYGRALKADPTNRDAAAGLARVGGTGSQR